MENPIKMDDLGGKPTIFGNTQIGPWNMRGRAIKPTSKKAGGGFPSIQIWALEKRAVQVIRKPLA